MIPQGQPPKLGGENLLPKFFSLKGATEYRVHLEVTVLELRPRCQNIHCAVSFKWACNGLYGCLLLLSQSCVPLFRTISAVWIGF